MNTGWSTARLIAAVVVIGAAAFGVQAAQDWTPFQVAARLSSAGHWSSIYPVESATSLFDVSPRFREAARESISDAGVAAFRPETLNAFISPPPAAFALTPLRERAWRTSMTVWRLALAIPLAISMLWMAAALSLRDPAATERWSWMSLLAVPFLLYVVYSGQPSAWLFVASAISMFPPTPLRDTAGGAALSLGVMFKATPLVAIVLLWLSGRRRLAAIAIGLAAIGSMASTGASGLDPWFYFGGLCRKLMSVVETDWNNGSLDAALLMLTTGADGMLHEPTRLSWTLGHLFRIVVIGLAIRLARRTTETAERRAMAAWLGWLAATPLLWMHYLIVLIPILGTAPDRRFRRGLVVVGLLSTVMALRFAGWRSGLHAFALCAAWLASAVWLLSNRTRTNVPVPTSPALS